MKEALPILKLQGLLESNWASNLAMGQTKHVIKEQYHLLDFLQ